MISHLRWSTIGFAGVIFLISSVALSDVDKEPALTRSVGIQEQKNLAEKFSVNYKNVFFGPHLAQLNSNQTSDSGADEHDPLKMESTLDLGYKVKEDVLASVVVAWDFQGTRSKYFRLSDPYAKLLHGAIVRFGNFNLSADLRMSIPVSEKSHSSHLLTAVASEQTISLAFLDSDLMLGLTTFFQRNIHREAADDHDLEYHVTPGVSYRMLSNLAVIVAYEMKMGHRLHSDLRPVRIEETALQPGVSWNITQALSFNPYIDLKLARPDASDLVSVGASVSWQAL